SVIWRMATRDIPRNTASATGEHMFKNRRRQLARTLGFTSDRPARRPRPGRVAMALENLESRDLPAPLTCAAGINLPLAEGGIAAKPEASGSLLVLAGPSTTSYNLSVTDPTWKATETPTYQPLDFARSSPGAGTLPNGYVLVFGGTQNGFAISSVLQYDPN